MKEFIEKLIGRLEEKFKYNSEQAEIWRSGSDKDSYFRQQKDLYMDRANTYGEVMRIVNQLAEEYNGGWIPCNKKLPKNWEYVYATCISLIDDREPWVIVGFYNNITGWKELTPMIYLGHAEVIAWKPYKLPAPYQPKGVEYEISKHR